MVKECKVTVNNDAVTVAIFNGVSVQFPSIRRNAKTVYVKSENGKYSIVDELTESIDNTAEESAEEEIVSKPKKKRAKKTTVEEETIVEDI